MQEFCIGDDVQLRDGNVYRIENIRHIPAIRAKDGIGGNLYTLHCLAFPQEYKSYYETRMHNEAIIVQFSSQVNPDMLQYMGIHKDDAVHVATLLRDAPISAMPVPSSNYKSKSVPVNNRPLAKVYILAEYRQRRLLRQRA